MSDITYERITDVNNPNVGRVLLADCHCENCSAVRAGENMPGFEGRDEWKLELSRQRLAHLKRVAARDSHVGTLATEMRERWAKAEAAKQAAQMVPA